MFSYVDNDLVNMHIHIICINICGTREIFRLCISVVVFADDDGLEFIRDM